MKRKGFTIAALIAVSVMVIVIILNFVDVLKDKKQHAFMNSPKEAESIDDSASDFYSYMVVDDNETSLTSEQKMAAQQRGEYVEWGKDLSVGDGYVVYINDVYYTNENQSFDSTQFTGNWLDASGNLNDEALFCAVDIEVERTDIGEGKDIFNVGKLFTVLYDENDNEISQYEVQDCVGSEQKGKNLYNQTIEVGEVKKYKLVYIVPKEEREKAKTFMIVYCVAGDASVEDAIWKTIKCTLTDVNNIEIINN